MLLLGTDLHNTSSIGHWVDGKSVGKSAEMVAIEQAYLTNNYITFTWKILRSGWWGGGGGGWNSIVVGLKC